LTGVTSVQFVKGRLLEWRTEILRKNVAAESWLTKDIKGQVMHNEYSIKIIFQNFVFLLIQQLGPLSLVSTTEELLVRKISGSGLEIREYGRRDPSR
jgi:hypothetical protein